MLKINTIYKTTCSYGIILITNKGHIVGTFKYDRYILDGFYISKFAYRF